MLGWLVRRQIAKFERNCDYDFTYARDIYDASPRAIFPVRAGFRARRTPGRRASRGLVCREDCSCHGIPPDVKRSPCVTLFGCCASSWLRRGLKIHQRSKP